MMVIIPKYPVFEQKRVYDTCADKVFEFIAFVSMQREEKGENDLHEYQTKKVDDCSTTSVRRGHGTRDPGRP